MRITIGEDPEVVIESGGDIPNGCVHLKVRSQVKEEYKELTMTEAYLLVLAISAGCGTFIRFP